MKRLVNVAVVPVRKFDTTKIRLESFLSREQRASLTGSLLNHVLGALERSIIDAVVLVVSDKRNTAQLVKKYVKVKVLKENSNQSGVNRAVLDGISEAEKNYPRLGSITILPSDLPLISTDAIDKVLCDLTGLDLIIGPSLKKDGTNLLLYRAGKGAIPLHYDDNSYQKHLSEARKRCLKYSICSLFEFGFDVDTRADLRYLMKMKNATTVSNLLEKLKLEG